MKLASRYATMVLFCAFCVKLLFLQEFSINYAPVLMILACLIAFIEYKTSDKQYVELKKQLDDQQRVIVALSNVTEDIKSQLSSVKVAQGMRSTRS